MRIAAIRHMDTSGAFAQGDEEKDKLPGQPWTPQPPSPDGGSPQGDGKHRK
ncbi:hypothetical protein [Streptomyces sp. ICBB 8177]|uniref:hypothetical protein n=1 Tax=Streptomyces sp. ICBB 8177 TaxID=563922 RepID=UPI0013050E4F|nr:hypothetical protein [Streptomyces sp. ICBB 8177]